MIKWFSRYLGKSVYPHFMPHPDKLDIYKGAEEFLHDFYYRAGFIVTFKHMILLLFIYISPFLYFKSIFPFPYLSNQKRSMLMTQMMFSRIYVVRLAFYAVKGHALISILRLNEAREAFNIFPSSHWYSS